MKIKTLITGLSLGLLLMLSGCNQKGKVTLKLDLEPFINNQEFLENQLPDASEIIVKRLSKFGISKEDLKSEVLKNRINLTINNTDSSSIPIIKNLATTNGKLGFWETYDNKDVIRMLMEANSKLRGMVKSGEYVPPAVKEAVPDTSAQELSIEDIINGREKTPAEDSSLKAFRSENPLFAILIPRTSNEGEPLPSCLIGLVKIADTAEVKRILRFGEIAACFPRDLKFMWSRYPYKYDDSKSMLELHAIKRSTILDEALIGGDVITKASAIYTNGEARINFSMNPEGAKVWARMTRENIDRCIAVVLDGYVRSYPRVMSEITGGNTEITGDFTNAEARYFSFLLGAGGNGLPLKLRISGESVIPD